MERAEGFLSCWPQGRRNVSASPCPSPAVLPFPAVPPLPSTPPPSQPPPWAPALEDSDSGDMDTDLGSALSADPRGCPLSPLVLIQPKCPPSPGPVKAAGDKRYKGLGRTSIWRPAGQVKF
ncbi:hypothetical protein ElyMa_001641400 [Elysia marginata]|uniref:Uncharacterized protein n=1 Tax=Elysia marginata TaxID=1093978 RepID=A0AAV4JKV3_9GAST|nr:hypothetical protein ElyMa_001641400 [Elysia marginata]